MQGVNPCVVGAATLQSLQRRLKGVSANTIGAVTSSARFVILGLRDSIVIKELKTSQVNWRLKYFDLPVKLLKNQPFKFC